MEEKQSLSNTPSTSSNKEQQERIKLAVLKKFHKNRHLLWPKHDGMNRSIKNEERQEAWERVHRELIEEGHTEFSSKSWRFLRDITWKNWRTRGLLKLEKMQKANYIQYSESERILMSIIDMESGRKSSNGTKSPSCDLQNHLTPIIPIIPKLKPIEPSTSNERAKKRQIEPISWEDRIAKQKYRKLQLENHLLELQIYEKKLQLNLLETPLIPCLNEEDFDEEELTIKYNSIKEEIDSDY